MFCMYKLYNCLKEKVSCKQVFTDTNGPDNLVNVKIHTSNKCLAMAQGDMPLGKLNLPTPEAKTNRSRHLCTLKSHL